MQKSEFIRARIEPELKSKVEKIFAALGLNVTEAITMFYKQVELNNGLPFDVKIPNKTTQKAIEETEKGINIIKCDDMEDLFKRLNS